MSPSGSRRKVFPVPTVFFLVLFSKSGQSMASSRRLSPGWLDGDIDVKPFAVIILSLREATQNGPRGNDFQSNYRAATVSNRRTERNGTQRNVATPSR
uniref:Putative secreted protein n=1 Tax=Anopheles marajoara TaxID=58244 RepID=A0A2M4CA46_9DIPT